MGTARAGGDEDLVPASLQAQLLAKIACYDRNFPARAGDRARVLLVEKRADPESKVRVAEMIAALAGTPRLCTTPHEEQKIEYTAAPALADLCKSAHISVVYLGPGLSAEIPAIRKALADLDILSVGAVSAYVPAGIVLGFELVSGKPKLLVHLTQAKQQHVNFNPDVLTLMRVYQ